MSNRTKRFGFTVPDWKAGWERWQYYFEALMNSFDATVFGVMESSRAIFASLPVVRVESIGGIWTFQMNGDAKLISRTYHTEIILDGTVSFEIKPGDLIGAIVTNGAVGPQDSAFQIFRGGVPIDPTIQIFGYVTNGYNIIWWNGYTSVAGAGFEPISSGGSGGGAGLFTYGSGALSTIRVGASNICEGDNGFVAGFGNQILGTAHNSGSIGNGNIVENSPGSNVSGDSNVHKDGGYSNISGRNNNLARLFDSTLAGRNIVHTHPSLESSDSVGNDITGAYMNFRGSIRYSTVKGLNLNFTGHTLNNNISGRSYEIAGGTEDCSIQGDIHRIGKAGTIADFVKTGSTIVMTSLSGHGLDLKVSPISIQVVNPGGNNGGFFSATVLNSSQLQWTNASGATELATPGSYWRSNSSVKACSITGFGHYVDDSFRSVIEGGSNRVSGVNHSRISGLNNKVKLGTSLSIDGEYNQVYGSNIDCHITGGYNRLATSNRQIIEGTNNGLGLFNIGSLIDLSVSGSTVTLTDPSGTFEPFFEGLLGTSIRISGSLYPANNGIFSVSYVISSTALQFINASAVNETSNGSLMWDFPGGVGSDNQVRGHKNKLVGSGGITKNFIEGDENILNQTGSGVHIRGNRNLLENGGGYQGGTIVGDDCQLINGAGRGSIMIGRHLIGGGGFYESLLAGYRNEANGGCAGSLTSGRYARNNNYGGSIVHSGGNPSDAAEDAARGQGQLLVAVPNSNTTSDATPTILYIDGAKTSELLITVSGSAYLLVTYVLAKCTAGDSVDGVKSWKIETLLNNVAGTLAIVNSITYLLGSTSIANEGDWVPEAYVHTESGQVNRFTIQVTGHANDTIRWQAFSQGPEVGIL